MMEKKINSYSELESKLIVGAKIKIGKKYELETSGNFKEGQIIELVEGTFESDCGDNPTIEKCPSIWCDKQQDFDSIYHLFGNGLEDFLDNEIL